MITSFKTDREILETVKMFAEQSSDFITDRVDYSRGYKEGMKQAKEVLLAILADTRRSTDSKVAAWYKATYPEDPVYPTTDVTFGDVYKALEQGRNFYDCIGIGGDSLVRERIFTELANLKGMDYSEIYDTWLLKLDDRVDDSFNWPDNIK